MALDAGIGTRQPRKKPPPVTVGPGSSQDRPPIDPATMPQGPPVRALQKHGVQMDREQAVEQVRRLTDAHERNFGTRPDPHLVFTVLRASVPTESIDRLFDLPATKRQARASAVLKTSKEPLPEAREEFETAQKRRAESQFDKLGVRGGLFPFGALVGVERARDLVPLLEAKRGEPQARPIFDRDSFGDELPAEFLDELGRIDPKKMQAAGFVGESFSTPLDPYVGLGVLATAQITTALAVGLPTLGFIEGQAVYRSVGQRSADPFVEANVELGKGIVESYKETYRHPWENPGYIALDLFGLLSVGAGAGARVAAVAKGASPLRRPLPGRTAIRVEGDEGAIIAEVLNSENALARLYQRGVRSVRQKRSNKREFGEPTGGLVAFTKKHLSFERKVGREFQREQQLLTQMRSLTARELERVTGWSEHVGRVQSKLPAKARRGLTRGEQMALLIESIDEPGGFAVRASALRRFHERMLRDEVGIPAAHHQKLRDIRLAEQAVRKPSGRFEKALTLIRDGAAEQQATKIAEFGLSPATAEARIAKVGEVLRTGEETAGASKATRQRPDSFYVKTEPVSRAKKLPKNPFRGKRAGQFGVTRPDLNRLVPETTHEFTGAALRQGDYRIDTTRLVGESVGRTVRASQAIREYRQLVQASSRTPRSEFDRPIRLTDDIPDELRRIVNATDEGEIVSREAGVLSKQDWDEMVRVLYPGEKINGEWRLPSGFEGKVRWVDERLLGPDAVGSPMRSSVQKFFQRFNEPFRTLILYARPAYWVNLLGATTMAWVYQGNFAAPNIVRALFADKLYGPRVAHAMTEMVGAGKFASYVDDTLSSKVSRRAAHAWNSVTDQRLRIATGFYYARRQGIKTTDDWNKLLDDAQAGDTAALRTVGEIKDRTNKAMVQFDNLTWPEQQGLRHVIFVYPWLRGASIWSVRTLVERPIKSDILAHIGDDTLDWIEDEFLGRVPEWFAKGGYIPTRFDADGTPHIVNPNNINTWSTLNDVLHRDFDEFLGPLGELVVRGVTGRDQFGNEYPGGKARGWASAAQEVLMGLPQLMAMKRGGRKDMPLPPIDVGERDSLAARVNAALRQTVFSPGWLNGYGTLILGGTFTERTVNKQALLARWYRDLSFEDRQAFNRELVDRGLKMQADLMDRSVPRQVREAIDLQFERDEWDHEWEVENERDPTPLEKTLSHVSFYEKRGLATVAEATAERKAVQAFATKDELEEYRTELFVKYADPETVLSDWDSDARRVAALTNPKIVNRRLAELAQAGLLAGEARKVTLKPAELEEYGRAVLTYAEDARRRRALVDQVSDPQAQNVAWAEYREWLDSQDKPVMVKGVRLPSPARIEWARYDAEKRRAVIADTVRRPWTILSGFDKTILGRKVEPKVAEGWRRLEEIIADYKERQPPGQRTLPRDFENQAARFVERSAPGFYKDWLFAREPLVRKLQVLPAARPKHRDWAAVEADAVEAARVMATADSKQEVRDAWHDYVKQTIEPWVNARPGLKEALSLYGSDFLYKLLD